MLAKKFNGEIISADSRQVYRGLNIGSGKVPGNWKTYSPANTTRLIRSYENDGSKRVRVSRARKVFIYQGVRHHCIDFASLRRVFTAAQFVSRALRAISEIARRGHIPIIAGGTAFWIDALVFDFSLPEVKPNARLRRALEKKSASELLAILKRLDPRRAEAIEQKNPRRLVRAIEIASSLGRVPKLKKGKPYRTFWLGLLLPPRLLQRRIAARAETMIKLGLAAETRRLLRSGVGKRRILELGFEYRAAFDYLKGGISKKELLARLVIETSAYAKRQMTWWKRNPEINWVRNPAETQRLLKKFLQKTD